MTNPDLELRLYGTDARNIQATEHNGIPDVWNGFTTSPVALTLRYKNAYLDLTGLTPTVRGARPKEDALENAHGKSARAASGREAR